MLTTLNPNSSATSPQLSTNMKKILLAATISVTCFHPTSALAQYNSQIQELVQRRQSYQSQADNLRVNMLSYMISNPKPTAALLASGVGGAAILEENLDPATKTVLASVGLVGVSYCLDRNNAYYCGQVVGKLLYYSYQISDYDRAITSISQRIRDLQQ